ncbi:MAG TPA: NAD-dependent epimerase/dehydratase family protein [Candidatus Ozemobacteraceae bacterium]|nr:NAD-dependent epimerase/dehydratase family protein [Candidatus Ozemobacteraceae bacterium]
MSPRKLLITGVNGFIGRNVALAAIRRGDSVYGTDLHSPEHVAIPGIADYQPLTLPSPLFAEYIGRIKPDTLIHCSGRASVPLSIHDPETDFLMSVNVTFRLLEQMRLECPNTLFVFLSSAAVYGNPQFMPVNEALEVSPISPYGFHKYMAEQACLEYAKVFGLRTTAGRIFSAYGPGLHRQVVWDIFRKTIHDPIVNLQGTGEETRDFLHVKDVAAALLLIADRAPGRGEVYNIASGQETSIAHLAQMIIEVLHRNVQVCFDGHNPPGMPLKWQADISRLRSLGFEPRIDIRTGLEGYAQWITAEISPE